MAKKLARKSSKSSSKARSQKSKASAAKPRTPAKSGKYVYLFGGKTESAPSAETWSVTWPERA